MFLDGGGFPSLAGVAEVDVALEGEVTVEAPPEATAAYEGLRLEVWPLLPLLMVPLRQRLRWPASPLDTASQSGFPILPGLPYANRCSALTSSNQIAFANAV